MESQIQIQSEAVEIVIPSGNDPANSSVVDRSRQQRQQATPATPSASAGQQKPQPHHQNQQGPNVSRVLIVSPSVQHQQQSSMHSMTTRSTNDRKLVAVSHHQSGGQMHHQVVQRQIVIQQPSSSPKCSSGEGPAPCYVLSNGQQQAATTATVQNGQLVLANLTSENRGRPRVQQQQHQVHRQQQILIIQQADRRTDELDKVDDPQSQEHSLPLGVAQTITVAVSDADGRGGDGTPAAIYPALQYVASSGEPVIAGAHHIVAAHHHSNSAAGATGAPSAADASHVIYHHSPVTASNQHSAVHLQSGAYAVYPGDTGGYSPQGHHYYAGQVSYQTTPLHSPTSTYIIQSSGGGLQHSPVGGGCNPVLGIHEDEAAAQQLSHTTRASPATIQWLLQNYETAEGVSLPRCTLYNHYLKHCSEHKLDPVNAASFGKLIRSVFLGLRTRRLGTRGNSKYHYYGIRIKPDSPLNRISDESMATMAMRQQPTNQSRRPRPMLSTPPAPSVQQQTNVSTASTMQGQQASLAASSSVVPHQSLSGEPGSDSGTPNSIQSNNATAATLPVASGQQQQQHQHQAGSASDGNKQYVGEGVVPDVMPPPLEHLESSFDRLGLTLENADKFFSAYRNHCEDILECVKNLLFSEVERCWRQFWQPEDVHGSKQRSPLDQEVESDLEDEDSMEHNSSGLTRMQLYSLCTLPVVQEFVQTMDFQFYQVLVDVLAPNVLKPIPGTLTQSIRNFAKRLESGLGLALQGAPDVILRIKLDAVGSLAQTLRRYTSLNHLAQAARAVLQNSAQIQQMLTDLNRVDFHNVQEQASWVCDCDPNIVDQIEKDFKNALERQKTLEHWGSWLETVVDQILGSYDVMNVVNGRQEHDASVVRLTSVARQFLLKWSFYSSMVMRDLTLRSAPSFGSFHLIRLLYDEYMFYLVEQRVARLTGQTTIAVMSQSYRNHVASLASGEQDYQAYQMHQQDNEDGRADQHGQECVMQPNHICHPLQHQFMCQQSAAGDASLTSMDQAGSDAVVAMTCSHGNTAGAGVVSYALSACPESTQSGEGRMEETEERNVVDEYFITMQEEQQGQRQSDTTNQPNTPVLSNTTPTQSTVDWGREQEGEESVAQGPVKTSGVLELSSPVKKRKMSLKFNGDSNAE